MNDRGPVFQGKLLEGIRNITCNQVRMGGVAPDDYSQGDDADRLLKFKQGLGGKRNLKGARNSDQVDPCLGKMVTQFINHIIDKSITVDLVVFRGHDGELVVFGIDETRLPWELEGHNEKL